MLGQLGANCSLEVIAMALKKSGIVRDHILKKSDFPKSFVGAFMCLCFPVSPSFFFIVFFS